LVVITLEAHASKETVRIKEVVAIYSFCNLPITFIEYDPTSLESTV
jgi:hypothetical protein